MQSALKFSAVFGTMSANNYTCNIESATIGYTDATKSALFYIEENEAHLHFDAAGRVAADRHVKENNRVCHGVEDDRPALERLGKGDFL